MTAQIMRPIVSELVQDCVPRWRAVTQRQPIPRTHTLIMHARCIVIALSIKSTDFVHDWATPVRPIPYTLVPPSVKTSHNVGESLSYMEYIAKNYNRLAEHTVFLGDAGPNHWHAPHNWYHIIRTEKPDLFYSFGKHLSDNNFRGRPWPSSELPTITAFLNTFNVTYEINKQDVLCGNEFVLSKKAILRYPRRTYMNIAHQIRNKPNEQWGYALDRIKGNLWS